MTITITIPDQDLQRALSQFFGNGAGLTGIAQSEPVKLPELEVMRLQDYAKQHLNGLGRQAASRRFKSGSLLGYQHRDNGPIWIYIDQEEANRRKALGVLKNK